MFPNTEDTEKDGGEGVHVPAPGQEREIAAAANGPSPAEPIIEVNWNAPLVIKIGDLLKSQGLTDVEFLVGEEQTLIRAHKLILAISSPVFLSMFYGLLPSESLITLPDCDSVAFASLLHYVYGSGGLEPPPIHLESSAESIEFENKMLQVLYVAHKYDIQGLQELCANKLASALNHWNVLALLSTAELYGLEELKMKCWALIQLNTRSVLNFHQHSIDYVTLLRIVQDDGLSIDEVKLFEFLNSWSEIECEKEELAPCVDNKLRRLGDILKFVRFPTMSSSDFANRVASKNLLGEEQVAKILTYICSTPQNQLCLRLDFPATRRTGQRVFGRCSPHPPPENVSSRGFTDAYSVSTSGNRIFDMQGQNVSTYSQRHGQNHASWSPTDVANASIHRGVPNPSPYMFNPHNHGGYLMGLGHPAAQINGRCTVATQGQNAGEEGMFMGPHNNVTRHNQATPQPQHHGWNGVNPTSPIFGQAIRWGAGGVQLYQGSPPQYFYNH